MASKITTLETIQQCQRCTLACTRYNVVMGRGDLPCDLLCIGEAPGKSEDLLGEAFVGEAGKLLDQMFLQARLINRSIYLTNVVLCHPTDKRGGANREPTQTEILACMSNVMSIVNWAQPRVVLLIGDVAEKYYKKTFPGAYHITHPAALLRTGGAQSPYYLKNIRILEEINASL